MNRVTRQHCFEHGKEGFEEDKTNCHWCQLRSFPTHATIPITVVNEIDDEWLPENFRFIDRMKYREGVEAAGDNFRTGCDCAGDGTACQFRGCDCLADLEEDGSDDDGNFDDDGGSVAGQAKKIYAYHTRGQRAGLLRSKLLDSSLPLYECHASCSCSAQCPNRVVERGRTVPLQIFRTKTRGWGVRCPEPIKKGQFIDCYLGEVITAAEADRRRHESKISQSKDVYLFALDKFTNPDSLDSRLNGPPLEVDGEFMSGPTRFINHSCDPNMRIFARVGDHSDKHLHDLALFAIRDIPRGQELTFDYVDGVADDHDDTAPNPESMTKCLCESDQCRGFLW